MKKIKVYLRPAMNIIAFAVVSCLSVSGQTKNPPLKISHLAGDIYVYTTYNLYKNVPVPSNSLYLVTNDGVVMIDTPWDTTQFQPLLDSIELRHKKKVVLCIATHYHEDRTAGLGLLDQKGIKTFTSKLTYELCGKNGFKQSRQYFLKDTVFTVGHSSIETYYAGEGHTQDNIVVWFEKEKVLYGGCLIKSVEATDMGNIKDANLESWPATINKLKTRFPDRKFIVPGHQDWKSKNSLDHTLQLLQAHRQQS